MTALELYLKHGHWGEHPEYPSKDWQYLVANDECREGYWEWVSYQLRDAVTL